MQADPSRLLTVLNNTGLQTKDNSLYQLLKQLIESVGVINAQIASLSSDINNVNNNISNVVGQVINVMSGSDSDSHSGGLDENVVVIPGQKGDKGNIGQVIPGFLFDTGDDKEVELLPTSGMQGMQGISGTIGFIPYFTSSNTLQDSPLSIAGSDLNYIGLRIIFDSSGNGWKVGKLSGKFGIQYVPTGNTIFTILDTGKVGIGTITPFDKLSVADNGEGGNTFSVRYNDSNPSLRFGIEQSSAFPWFGANTVQGTGDTQTYEATGRFPVRQVYNATVNPAFQIQIAAIGAVGGTITWTNAIGITSVSQIIMGGPVNLKGYTVATLPAPTKGDIAYCTDLLAPVFLGIAVGGGAVNGPVFYDGTNWVTC